MWICRELRNSHILARVKIAPANDSLTHTAAEDEIVYLRPEAYNRVFKNKPQMMDTSKVFASMNKDSAQLAANMKTALKTQNGVELRREMTDYFRKLVAVYKAGGNLNSIPHRINVKKIPEKYQKMKMTLRSTRLQTP